MALKDIEVAEEKEKRAQEIASHVEENKRHAGEILRQSAQKKQELEDKIISIMIARLDDVLSML